LRFVNLPVVVWLTRIKYVTATRQISEVSPSVATARILADSISEAGYRLITVEATFARSALAELNTHRSFSRNSASSRAIPVAKMLAQAMEHPFIPRRFSLAQKGMSASEFVEPRNVGWSECVAWWLYSRDRAVEAAQQGLELGLHKQDVNRLLEPFLMHTAIISATEWGNFFQLRMATDDMGSPLAYPPIYDLAAAIQQAINESKPESIWSDWHWHLPLVFTADDDLSQEARIKLSVARCARVSYLTHDGRRDPTADLDLYERLRGNGHWSPFEHAAHPHFSGSANFRGWKQARWYVEHGDHTL
jgi:thymidylate synthase ThyX